MTALTTDHAVDTPLADAADAFLRAGTAHFATPGHKRNPALVGDDPLLLADAPLAWGVDDLQLSTDVLGRAEELAARAWGGERARFSLNGSTLANQALCLSLGAPGDRVIVARSAHKSVHAGLALAGLEPVWVCPELDPRTGLALGLPARRVADALREAPDARAVLLVEPSYLGVVSDRARIADLAHARGIPLVCDQAWGAHFGFHRELPAGGLAAGADAIVTSLHKTLTAFSQGSLVVVRDTGRIDCDRLDAAFDALLTTSPSAAIYASLDRARALVEQEGHRLLWRAWALARWARDELHGVGGVRALGPPTDPCSSVHALDPLKLVLDLGASDADGLAVERALRARGVVVEMADQTTIVPLITIGDGSHSVRRLIRALREALAECAGTAVYRPRPTAAWAVRPVAAMSPREAFFAPRERVRAEAAAGRVAAELVAPYPPGIPVLAPGEIVQPELLDALRAEADAGTRIAGVSDRSLATMLVVDERRA